jgi:hypothetical protein
VLSNGLEDLSAGGQPGRLCAGPAELTFSSRTRLEPLLLRLSRCRIFTAYSTPVSLCVHLRTSAKWPLLDVSASRRNLQFSPAQLATDFVEILRAPESEWMKTVPGVTLRRRLGSSKPAVMGSAAGFGAAGQVSSQL